MNPKHVTNLELSKQLFEAGITKDFESEFVWMDDGTLHREAKWRYEGRNAYPALLLSELLELMPATLEDKVSTYFFKLENEGGLWTAGWFNYSNSAMHSSGVFSFTDDQPTAMQALSSLASYLLREGKFKP